MDFIYFVYVLIICLEISAGPFPFNYASAYRQTRLGGLVDLPPRGPFPSSCIVRVVPNQLSGVRNH